MDNNLKQDSFVNQAYPLDLAFIIIFYFALIKKYNEKI